MKFKSFYKNEWTWRLFCVLQVVGIIGITFLAITNHISEQPYHWHILPYNNTYYHDELTWDLLDYRFWTIYHENWYLTAFLVAPFSLSKAIDWILEAKNKNSSTGN